MVLDKPHPFCYSPQHMEKTNPHRYIAVDGPIGAGKTTVAQMLANDISGNLVLEPVEKNPFLNEFYKDRRRNAFKTQLFFLLNRYQQQQELKQHDLFSEVTVCDYTFAKDLIFATINLNEDENNLYNTVYSLLDSKLPKPDIVVYLQADPEILLQRIKKRNNDYERPIGIEYIKELTNAYNEYFFHYKETPLLIVNCNDMNIVESGDDWDNLKSAIFEHRKGTALHHYIGK